jgi:ketosteroid isomerase-like protein
MECGGKWRVLGLGLCLLACARTPDRAAMTAEILQLHRALIDAHVKHDPDALFETIAEDYVAVANGDIQFRQKDEFRAALGEYIRSTDFTEYRDLREPIVGFSDDGSLAWSIVQVKVAGRRSAADGSKRPLDFTCAWITLFRRTDGGWERFVEASSFK